ncbi:CoA-binding protein [Notoacmeibacter sp. MSK16QG-6]|uniref:CoA-binding protein n=1 Tax=Notoacmeibacter sp. MSK16QG-6 TaxID=2957982 RepID=UPI00209D0858|nr:CoA-binding protein [Notoacmeibacter sp. MSK16QG-6]MCP1198429.1 CoA-binding protein [Notoacmeibacter sp. MSK16QG-6]
MSVDGQPSNHDHYDKSLIVRVLSETKTIAVLGASANPVRPSYFVVKYLLDKGYEVWPVNPGQAGKPICGAMTYANLADLPATPDMIDIFRAPDAVPGIVDNILAMDALPRFVWMQLGVRHDESAAKLEAAGVTVIMNRCPKIEYARLSGEIGWNGVNSRVLSARKPVAGHKVQSLGIRRDR